MNLTTRCFARWTLTTWVLLVGVTACSHVEVDEIPITANPTEEINKLEGERAVALTEQVDVLAPGNFKKASKSLHDAAQSRDSGSDSKVILRHVAEGRAHMKKAREIAQISRTTLASTVQARADAVAAGAPNLTSKDFKAVDDRLINATEEIEEDDIGAAEKSRDGLTKDYASLEVKAIKIDKLAKAKNTIDQAAKEGGDKTAARTFGEAQKALLDAEKYIDANRHDKAGIQSQAEIATASADHFLNVTRQVKVVDKKQGEELVLEAEAQQRQLDAEKAENERKQAELSSVSAQAASLGTAKNQLEAEKSEQARLESAKAQFTAEEADVYRDGNRLVVRLKALAFPSGKATLPTESLALLGKVQNVLRDVKAGQITVEGHTDSVGDKAKNQKLSEARASTVSTYLISNGFEAASIKTIGYGDTKPVAANKTKEGRAQNRRVDVIVEPAPIAH